MSRIGRLLNSERNFAITQYCSKVITEHILTLKFYQKKLKIGGSNRNDALDELSMNV